MDLMIAANPLGVQLKALQHYDADFEVNGEEDKKNFEISIDSKDYSVSLSSGHRVFIPNTEIGGIIDYTKTDTKQGKVTVGGFTWRGILYSRIIEPASGNAYRTVAGGLDLTTVCNNVLSWCGLSDLFGFMSVSNIKLTKNHQFKRYCTVYDGIVDLLEEYGQKLVLKYAHTEPNSTGRVYCYIEPIKDLSNDIEVSQDVGIYFTTTSYGVPSPNHVIVGGKGELTSRTIIHLYLQADGSIGTTKYYAGIKERVHFYSNTSAESEELEKEARKWFADTVKKNSLKIDAESLNLDAKIGDIVGTRDYITGNYCKSKIKNIIYKFEDGEIEMQYIMEE